MTRESCGAKYITKSVKFQILRDHEILLNPFFYNSKLCELNPPKLLSNLPVLGKIIFLL